MLVNDYLATALISTLPNRLEQLVVIKLNSDLCENIDLSKPETEKNTEESDDEEEKEVEEEEILNNRMNR